MHTYADLSLHLAAEHRSELTRFAAQSRMVHPGRPALERIRSIRRLLAA